VFTTSDTRSARAQELSTYDAFVQSAADRADLGSGWLVIGSSRTEDAFDHILPLFSDLDSVPIYNTAGARIADSFNDLWDGFILNPIGVNEFGSEARRGVWTGTWLDGTATRPLGPGRSSDNTTIGLPWLSNRSWIVSSGVSFSRYDAAFYGISQQINAPGDPAGSVPTPSTLPLVATAIFCSVWVRRKFVTASAGRHHNPKM